MDSSYYKQHCLGESPLHTPKLAAEAKSCLEHKKKLVTRNERMQNLYRGWKLKALDTCKKASSYRKWGYEQRAKAQKYAKLYREEKAKK